MSRARNPVCIEFRERSAAVLDGEEGLEIPIQRQPNGKLTPPALDHLANRLREFSNRSGWSAPRRAICGIPARGVTLRRISLPPGSREDTARLLALQIEARFPVPPEELSWGFQQCNGLAGEKPSRDFLVAAVKTDFVADYLSAAAAAGLAPELTLSALSRLALIRSGRAVLLDLGETKSELLLIDEQGAPSLRVLPWGTENLAGSSDLIRAIPNGEKVYLTGVNAPLPEIAARLSSRCEIIPIPLGPGRTAANVGAARMIESGWSPLPLGTQKITTRPVAATAQWKWAAAACLLLLLLLFSLRYAEALACKGRVAERLAQLQKHQNELPKIDRELSFLQFIKTNQPPYLDALTLIAHAAPAGTRIDSVSIVRRGEVNLRGSTTGDPQAPGKFRSSLVDSGFFSKVVLEEQTPDQNGQKVTFRLAALLKPEQARKPLPPEALKPSTNHPPPVPGPGPIPRGTRPGRPGMAMPPGAPRPTSNLPPQG